MVGRLLERRGLPAADPYAPRAGSSPAPLCTPVSRPSVTVPVHATRRAPRPPGAPTRSESETRAPASSGPVPHTTARRNPAARSAGITFSVELVAVADDVADVRGYARLAATVLRRVEARPGAAQAEAATAASATTGSMPEAAATPPRSPAAAPPRRRRQPAPAGLSAAA